MCAGAAAQWTRIKDLSISMKFSPGNCLASLQYAATAT